MTTFQNTGLNSVHLTNHKPFLTASPLSRNLRQQELLCEYASWMSCTLSSLFSSFCLFFYQYYWLWLQVTLPSFPCHSVFGQYHRTSPWPSASIQKLQQKPLRIPTWGPFPSRRKTANAACWKIGIIQQKVKTKVKLEVKATKCEDMTVMTSHALHFQTSPFHAVKPFPAGSALLGKVSQRERTWTSCESRYHGNLSVCERLPARLNAPLGSFSLTAAHLFTYRWFCSTKHHSIRIRVRTFFYS